MAQQERVLEASAQIISRVLDDEISRLDNVLENEDEMKRIRTERLAQMKKDQEMKNKWRTNGHGHLKELRDERDFFRAVEASDRVVGVFTLPTNKHGARLCEHLQVVATHHLETMFLKLDASQSPFLTDKLKIQMVPSVVLIKDGKSIHTMTGLSELSASGEYETWELERVLFHYGMLSSNDLEERAAKERSDNQDDY
eukprot:c23214_g1_i1.p1 GENE.c23214_g1_i1~~c23214_g1_i1.p1  ORF type:complete len:224 (+),score=62.57 c23214_g1_i1:79-672(+)